MAVKKALDKFSSNGDINYTLNGAMLGYDPIEKKVNIGLIGAVNMTRAINGSLGLEGRFKPAQVAVVQAIQGKNRASVDKRSKSLSNARMNILRAGKMELDPKTNKRVFTVDSKVYSKYVKEQLYQEKMVWQGVIQSAPKEYKHVAREMAKYNLANYETQYSNIREGKISSYVDFGGRPLKVKY